GLRRIGGGSRRTVSQGPPRSSAQYKIRARATERERASDRSGPMAHKHEVVVKPFSDVHNKGGHVVATLLHDPTVEGLDVALYIDGSASMEDEYGPRGILAKLGPVRNQVEPQVQWM